MNVFKHMSVKWKIYLIAVVSICGFGGYLGFNVWVNTNNAKLLTNLREAYFPILEKATQSDVNLDRISEALNNAAMTAETDHIDQAQQISDKINALLDEIYRLEPERKQSVKTLQTDFNTYFAEAKGITSDMLSGEANIKQMVARAAVKEEKLASVNRQLEDFIAYAHAKFSGSIDTANRNSNTMLTSGFIIWGVCILIMAITVYAIARIILGNINRVSNSLDELAHGSDDFSKKITVDSQDEIGKLAASFNALLENLRIKTNDLMCMMQHMHTGLFTINEDESIHREYSACIEQIFETRDVAGVNYSELLFRHALLGADVRDQVSAAVTSLLGADEMMFAFNSHLLVNEFRLHVIDDNGTAREKILEVDWDAIITDEVITRLMVTVRDVTELRAMQAAAEEQKMELEIVGQILKLTPARFKTFADNAMSLLDRNETIIRENSAKNLGVIAELFANMHTIKGNARTYQLSYITDTVHETETTYDRLRKEDELPWQQAQLFNELNQVREALHRYINILNDKLSFASGSAAALPADSIVINKADMQSLLAHIEPLMTDAQHNPALFTAISSVASTLRGFDTQPLPKVLESLLDTLPNVAEQLGKVAPRIQFEGETPAIFNAHTSTITNVFSHVLKNAIDHGIETPQERQAKGKPEQGTITLRASTTKDHLRLEVFDDGKGLNLKRLCEKMSEQGMFGADLTNVTPQRVADGMFMSGVSTAEQLTDISGRGVGMDAVKKYLNGMGCDIQIELAPDITFEHVSLAQGFVPFKLVVTLGDQVCHLPGATAVNSRNARKAS